MLKDQKKKRFCIPIVRNGVPVCAVVLGSEESEIKPASMFQDTVRREMARMVPIVSQIEESSCANVLFLWRCGYQHEANAELADLFRSTFTKEALGEEGFVIRSSEINGKLVVCVFGQTVLSVCYGVQYLIDCCWSPNNRSLELSGNEIMQRPDFRYRSAYNLTCWGNAAKNSLEGWKGVTDTFAAARFNRQGFWVSGMFRSSSLPATFCGKMAKSTLRTDPTPHTDYPWGYGDSPMDNNAIRELVIYAQKRMVKLNLMTGLFEWHYTYGALNDPEIHPRCPSSPAAREYATTYVLELLEAFPDVPGLFLELRGEDGGCTCEVCSRVIDDDGNRQFGESLGSYMEELLGEIWSRRPNIEIAVGVGYNNSSTDPNFLEHLSRIDNERFYAWICRPQPDGMPARDGRRVPPSYYFKKRLTWIPANRLSFKEIRQGFIQAWQDGCIGVVSECDPGFYQTVNLWHDYDLPYDGQELCYRVKQFAFGLFSWNKEMSMTDMKQAIHSRFFDQHIPFNMVHVLMDLVEKVRILSAVWHGRYWTIFKGGDCIEEWMQHKDTAYKKNLLDCLKRRQQMWKELPDFLDQTEERIAGCEVGASRRSRETLCGMRRLLLDIKGPIIGPENFLFPQVEESSEDAFPIMSLKREEEVWIERIDAELTKRRNL